MQEKYQATIGYVLMAVITLLIIGIIVSVIAESRTVETQLAETPETLVLDFGVLAMQAAPGSAVTVYLDAGDSLDIPVKFTTPNTEDSAGVVLVAPSTIDASVGFDTQADTVNAAGFTHATFLWVGQSDPDGEQVDGVFGDEERRKEILELVEEFLREDIGEKNGFHLSELTVVEIGLLLYTAQSGEDIGKVVEGL